MKFTAKNIFSHLGLVVAAIAVILLLLPHDDRQSYNYELNQPWRYQLLTADFDMPILRDSASAKLMRDSIDRVFIPFVSRNENVATQNIKRFSRAIEGKVTPIRKARLEQLLTEVYNTGVVSPELYAQIHKDTSGQLRVAEADTSSNSVSSIDASLMMSPQLAFRQIDSVYNASLPPSMGGDSLRNEVAQILSNVIVPNVEVDSVADDKYRRQEYLTVNGAMGVIKKGQRIVDRGEIITPQIYTNLDTYMEMANQNQLDENKTSYFLLGQALYILLCFIGIYAFLIICRPTFLSKFKNMVFLISFITLYTAFAILMFEYVSNGIYFVPFAAIPVVITVFFDSRTAIFSLLCTVLISALVAVFPFQFIFMEITAGLTAAFSIHTLERRSQLLRTALFTFLAYVAAYIITNLVTEGNLQPFDWHIIGAFAINAVILSFAYFLILIVEKIYGFTSTVTLVELSDINNKLLRRLAEEAPGTFQHSMQVSTLAAEAARAVGANTQLVRTGALYHDIGKLDGPIFFTENQHGVNPHTGLDPETSARKIISHVSSGLNIARNAKLPDEIRRFISEHHGKSLAKFFYNTAVNNSSAEEVDKSLFTYPGPNPQSRETAILMMADAVEAASRSLDDYTPKAIDNLVDRIIDTQESDGLFNESPISFRDVQTIKNTFKKRLSTIYHSRVAYPEIKKAPK